MPATPTVADVIRKAIESRLADVHTAMPGKVKSYDRVTQTADVMPLVNAVAPMADGSDELEELPVIPNVRVLWPRAGGAYLHMPMAAGDYVLLVFNEAAIGHWRAGAGEPAPPGDVSRHSLSYPYAIPGGWPDAGAFELPPPESESYTTTVLLVPGVLRVVRSDDPSDQFVAGGEKVNTELESLQSMVNTLAAALNTFSGAMATWAGAFAPGGAPGAATGATAAAAAATAAGALTTAVSTFQGQLAAWPAATVEMDALKTE